MYSITLFSLHILQVIVKMKPDQELHLAVQENDERKVEKLLDSGVDINCLFYAWTPLQHAINLGE